MPISTTDPYYRAEVVPASLNQLGGWLCAEWGLSPAAYGTKGNTVHYSGYHRSRRWILNSPDSRYGASDYSVRQPLDAAGDWNWISAFDLTPGSTARMIAITRRVYEAAKQRDPRLAGLREFAGTLDGTTVITFNCADGSLKAPFDASHLWHVHGSFWRSKAADNHAGIHHVMAGITASLTVREDAMFLASNSGAVVLTNGLHGRWLLPDELPHILALHNEGTQPLTFGGKVREVAFLSMLGKIEGARPSNFPPDEELEAIKQAIQAAVAGINTKLSPEQLQELITAVIAAPNNRLTEEDLPILTEAAERGAKQAAREGTESTG